MNYKTMNIEPEGIWLHLQNCQAENRTRLRLGRTDR